MLSYLADCARAGIEVIAYEDQASGTMAAKDGRMRFVEVTLALSGARQGLTREGPRGLLHRELRELPGPEHANRDPRLIQTGLRTCRVVCPEIPRTHSSSCGHGERRSFCNRG